MIFNFRLPILAEWLRLKRLGEFMVRLEETRMKIGNRKLGIGNQP
jgi:hypothetical protein